MYVKALAVASLGLIGLLGTGCTTERDDRDAPYSLTGDIDARPYADQRENNWHRAKGIPPYDLDYAYGYERPGYQR